jgi:hypothetical protein
MVVTDNGPAGAASPAVRLGGSGSTELAEVLALPSCAFCAPRSAACSDATENLSSVICHLSGAAVPRPRRFRMKMVACGLLL